MKGCMIAELVVFDLPKDITREEVIAKYRQTAPAWSRNEDLVRKFYFFDAARNQGGGVYPLVVIGNVLTQVSEPAEA
jgi:hypothetical protein